MRITGSGVVGFASYFERSQNGKIPIVLEGDFGAFWVNGFNVMTNRPCFTISTFELAKWLREYGAGSWWTVDGDSILGGRLSFPCPAGNLADALAHITGNLLLLDKDRSAESPSPVIDSTELNQHVNSDAAGERVLEFAWQKTPKIDWLLIEDKEAARVGQIFENAQS